MFCPVGQGVLNHRDKIDKTCPSKLILVWGIICPMNLNYLAAW